MLSFKIEDEKIFEIFKKYQPYLHGIDMRSFKLGIVFGLLLMSGKIK